MLYRISSDVGIPEGSVLLSNLRALGALDQSRTAAVCESVEHIFCAVRCSAVPYMCSAGVMRLQA